MTKLEQFFYDHAGWAWDPAAETEAQGRERCAKALAEAAHHALDQGWTYEWALDPGERCECGDLDCDHAVEYCQLWDADDPQAEDAPLLLASLSGIAGATDEYRRVVQAELALEVMGRA